MITFDELNTQNHRITELSNVLSYLFADRYMCDTNITVTLFFEYVNAVKHHLELEDKHLYSKLLTHKERSVNNTAAKFLSGSKEIKRIFAAYLKKWCRKHGKELKIKDHDEFIRETEEMFDFVLKRIQDETEHLYPLLREVAGDRMKAA
ncbi:MAG: hypothetical protein ABFS23_06535 [Pseudomonadota bacterium]